MSNNKRRKSKLIKKRKKNKQILTFCIFATCVLLLGAGFIIKGLYNEEYTSKKDITPVLMKMKLMKLNY